MFKHILFSLFCCLSIASCIDPIDIDTPAADKEIVIDGLFTNQLETQTIKISTSVNIGDTRFIGVSGADVSIIDQNGTAILFTEGEEGIYQTQSQAITSNQYKLNITLSGGEVIESAYQNVPSSFPMDSVSIVDTLVVSLSQNGSQNSARNIDFYAHSSSSSVDEDFFLRYSVETAFQQTELICSPFFNPETCYTYNDQPPFNIALLAINPSDEAVRFNTFVYRRLINYAFGEIFAMKLSLYSYNFKEYDYWSNLKSIFDQDGNITDVLPSRLEGNLKTTEGERVLGHFAVVGKSEIVRIVRNSDFTTFVNPYCGAPGFPPFPRPEACCFCLALDGATLVRPPYFP